MSNYDDTSEATKRFYAELNKQNAMRGLPPVSPPRVRQHPRLLAFTRRGSATEEFLAMNDERVAQGLPPIGCKGQPLTADPRADYEAQVAEAMLKSGAPGGPIQEADPFWRGEEDFNGNKNSEFAGVKVRRFKA